MHGNAVGQHQRDREDGIRELIALDLFKVSIVPAPANPDTRFLNLKGEAASRTGEFDFIFVAGLQASDSKSVRRKSTEPIRFASFEL